MDHAALQAFVVLNTRQPISDGDILVNPNLRSEFLDLARQEAGPVREEQALRCLLNLRKRNKLPRDR
jgi:hypothetical protein